MGRLIDADALLDLYNMAAIEESGEYGQGCLDIIDDIRNAPTVDAVPVVHGKWEKCGGDLHSSGYAVYCSVCNKKHFVHWEHSLGGLYAHKELFTLPNYCPQCGAKMDLEEVI